MEDLIEKQIQLLQERSQADDTTTEQLAALTESMNNLLITYNVLRQAAQKKDAPPSVGV